jgi:hypothetical protein
MRGDLGSIQPDFVSFSSGCNAPSRMARHILGEIEGEGLRCAAEGTAGSTSACITGAAWKRRSPRVPSPDIFERRPPCLWLPSCGPESENVHGTDIPG